MPFLLLPAFVLLVLCLPVLLPVIGIMEWRDRRTRERAATTTACVVCGVPLGHESLARADLAWAEHMAALHARYPHHKLRVVRHVRAICGACGARYAFEAGRFTRYEGMGA